MVDQFYECHGPCGRRWSRLFMSLSVSGHRSPPRVSSPWARAERQGLHPVHWYPSVHPFARIRETCSFLCCCRRHFSQAGALVKQRRQRTQWTALTIPSRPSSVIAHGGINHPWVVVLVAVLARRATMTFRHHSSLPRIGMDDSGNEFPLFGAGSPLPWVGLHMAPGKHEQSLVKR